MLSTKQFSEWKEMDTLPAVCVIWKWKCVSSYRHSSTWKINTVKNRFYRLLLCLIKLCSEMTSDTRRHFKKVWLWVQQVFKTLKRSYQSADVNINFWLLFPSCFHMQVFRLFSGLMGIPLYRYPSKCTKTQLQNVNILSAPYGCWCVWGQNKDL